MKLGKLFKAAVGVVTLPIGLLTAAISIGLQSGLEKTRFFR